MSFNSPFTFAGAFCAVSQSAAGFSGEKRIQPYVSDVSSFAGHPMRNI